MITNNYIGIGKTKFNSSVCLLTEENNLSQIWLSERLSRKKCSGEWPSKGLIKASQLIKNSPIKIAENRDVELSKTFEDFYNSQFPFYEFLVKNKIDKFSTKFNPEIIIGNHHEAHAYAALAISPFEKSIIVVMDGAGNRMENDLHEICSVYLQNCGHLSLVYKKGVILKKENYKDGIGLLYEETSKYIFNNPNNSGKVMGLAPFGNILKNLNRHQLLNYLDDDRAFIGKSKLEWENSANLNWYKDVAATIQYELELEYEELLISLKNKYPDYHNLILMGGCALNCTNNAKILNKKLFAKVYVPPFPGDESIGFGLAHFLRLKANPEKWIVSPLENQNAYFGPLDSMLSNELIEKKLSETKFQYEYMNNLTEAAVSDLVNGKIIGWFQGRSESGPRALGNRSILVRPDRDDIKNILNSKIKFRESFRPYGCSIIQEYVSEYFNVDADFDSPFMSFAVQVKHNYLDRLKYVTHIDGTSRMQTVREKQNSLFYHLIKEFGLKTNLFCLLNTSLNVMGEPIVETIEDAILLFEKTNLDALYIGNFKLTRK